MNSREKEIRKILNGYYLLNDAYRIEEGEDLRDIQNLQGSIFSSHLVGLLCRAKQFRSALSEEELTEECAGILLEHGLPVDLHTAPDAFALLVEAGPADDYIITAEINGSSVLLSLYMAKSLFARFRVKRLFRKWLGRFEALSLTEEPVTMSPQQLLPAAGEEPKEENSK